MNKLANGVVYRGDFYPLNSQEFSLVALLYHNRGMVLTHSYLCEDLWPSDDVPSSRISSLMSQIRNHRDIMRNKDIRKMPFKLKLAQ